MSIHYQVRLIQEVSRRKPDIMPTKERMLITGGNPLQGEVRVSGGKNTAVAVIPATLLCDEPCTIENLPDIADVYALVDILRALGAKVEYVPNLYMKVDPRPADGWIICLPPRRRAAGTSWAAWPCWPFPPVPGKRPKRPAPAASISICAASATTCSRTRPASPRP